MSDTNVQECNCCQIETDCIEGLCELCLEYNLKQAHRLQKQSDLLTLGLLQEKQVVVKLQAENERLRLVIVDVHDLSYPGLAIKEGTLLNKIYKLTTGYNTEQALKGGE